MKKKDQKVHSREKNTTNLQLITKKYLIIVFVLLIVFVFGIYLRNLSLSVFGGDSGDLVSAIAVRGVPHPSGYPLHTFLGILFSFLPIDQPLAWKVGMVSSLFSALTVGIVFAISWRIFRKTLYALITALTLAFIFPFWLYAEIQEVVALHHFFIALLFFLALLFRQTQKKKYLYFLAIFTGLSLTNNESIVLLFPVLAFMVFSPFLKENGKLKAVMLSTGFLLVGLLPYLYIPLAASFNPPINWNNAQTINNFFHLVLRKDYGWLPAVVIPWAVRILVLGQFQRYLISEFNPVLISLMILGIFSSFFLKKDRVLPLSLLLGFFLFGPFFIGYGAGPSHDVFSNGTREKFYASSCIFLILFIPFGFECLSIGLQKLFKRILPSQERALLYTKTVLLFFFIIPLLLFIKNVEITNLSKDAVLVDHFAYDILTPLEKKSILISKRDNVTFPSWYMQFSRDFRRDIYLTLPPELIALAERGALRLKEKRVTKIEVPRYEKVDAVALSVPGPVYISETNYHRFIRERKITLYPHGLVWKYVQNPNELPTEEAFVAKQDKLLSHLHLPEKSFDTKKLDHLWLIRTIPTYYAHAYSNTGYFLMYAYQDYDLAESYFKSALSIDQLDDSAYEGLGIAMYKQKDFLKAQEYLQKAVEVQPLNKNAYYLLYLVTSKELHDKQETRNLDEFFNHYSEIYKEFDKNNSPIEVP